MDYVEESVFYTQFGREIIYRNNPRKMHPLSIAKGIYFDLFQQPDIFIDAFMKKISPIIDSVFDTPLLDEKPTREDIRNHENYKRSFKQVLQNNLDNVLEGVLGVYKSYDDTGYIAKTSIAETENSRVKKRIPYYDAKIINQAVFDKRMMESIYSLRKSKGVEKVIEDYRMIESYRDGSMSFGTLEKRSESLIKWFIFNNEVRGFDFDDLYQESLLTLLGTAKNYQGQNFARFNTMLRKSLRNKTVDLIRYISADKRKLDIIAKLAGSLVSTKESKIAHEIDNVSFRLWQEAQNDQVRDLEALDDPFETYELEDIFRSLPPRVTERYAIFDKSFEDVDENNFPHVESKPIVLVNQRDYDFYAYVRELHNIKN